jgi:hypothetical protein
VTTTQTADPRARRRSALDRPAGRTGTRPAPQRVPELAPLCLDELRAFRQELITEEARVSYWRRLVHARLDLAGGDESSMGRLRGVLTDHQRSSQRLAMQTLDGHLDLPPLPDLTVLWESQPTEDDDAIMVRLAAAERELSDYRRGLHERLDAATGELIARYRDEPALALRALPLPRTQVGVA